MNEPDSLRRVLVVDDDPELLAALSTGLQAAGHEVGTAADGFDAVTAASRASWDLILLDLRVPYRNGVEILRILRTREDTASIPVCALTTAGDEPFAERALREGASGMLDKSQLDASALLRRVEAILRALPRASERLPDEVAEALLEPATATVGAIRAARLTQTSAPRSGRATQTAPISAAAGPGRASQPGAAASAASVTREAAGAPRTSAILARTGPQRGGSLAADPSARTGSITRPLGAHPPRTQAIHRGATEGGSATTRIDGRRGGRGTIVPTDIAPDVPIVPSAVEEIARRFQTQRLDADAGGAAGAGAGRDVRSTEAAAADAAAPAIDDPSRPAPTGHVATPGLLQAAVAAAHAGPFADRPLQRADVVHYRIGSQLAPVARAVGVAQDAACPSCGSPIVLRLEPDLRFERAVRGRFVCPQCPPDRV